MGKQFLKIAIAIQLAMIVVVSLGLTGFDIPVLRPLVASIYLIFLPGIIILIILKLNKLPLIETLLYSVGLSISFLMFLGLFMNTLYPVIGISKPISILPLVITLTIVISVLCAISYRVNKDFLISISGDMKKMISSTVLFLVSLPILSIIGAYFVDFYGNNFILGFLILVISIITILAIFNRISTKQYPLAIFMIALALIFHRTFIPFYYLPTGDIMYEYFFYKLVEMNSLWDSTIITYTYNAMVSITILPTIYSSLSNMEGTWVFKIIYPLIFSFVPVGLYQIWKKQTDDRTAFLAAFVFMAFHGFFITIPTLARQEIAELFLVLLILLMIDTEMNKAKRAILSIIFSLSLVVSHYSITYIYMFYILLVLFLLPLIGRFHIHRFLQNISVKVNKFEKAKPTQKENPLSDQKYATSKADKTITITFVILFVVFALAWYMYVSSSSSFIQITHFTENVYNSIFTDFFAVEARETAVLKTLGIEAMRSFWHSVARSVFQIMQFFIIVGVIKLIAKHKEMKFNREYATMVLISGIILLMCMIIPSFSQTSIHIDRIYHVTLLFLAPLCILGGETIFQYILKLFRFTLSKKSIYILLLLTVLVPHFLFSTGFVYEVTGDIPNVVPLSMTTLKTSDEFDAKEFFYIVCIQEQDIYSAKWLQKNRIPDSPTYAHYISINGVLRSYGSIAFSTRFYPLAELGDYYKKDSLIYLGYFDVKENNMLNDPSLVDKSRVYSNGGSIICR